MRVFMKGILRQSLAEVGDEVALVLDADGDADERVGDADRGRSSALMPTCDIAAGRETSVSTPPRLGAWRAMRTRPRNCCAASAPPFGSKLSMPPKPRRRARGRGRGADASPGPGS